MTSIAATYGFADPKKLFEHPQNAELRKKRPSPDLLHPGDEVTIPDVEPATFTVQTGQRHKFVIKRPRKRLVLALVGGDGEPLASGPFEVQYDGGSKKGDLGADGKIDVELPANVHEATLVVAGREWRVLIGHLNPMRDTADGGVTGAQARLANLGFTPGSVDGVRGPKTRAALRRFQEAAGLEVTGELDENTIKALEDEHGC